METIKRADGGALLRRIRQDGSGDFFGLVAEGWNLEDTTGQGWHGPLPDGATEAEKIVGLFGSERASGRPGVMPFASTLACAFHCWAFRPIPRSHTVSNRSASSQHARMQYHKLCANFGETKFAKVLIPYVGPAISSSTPKNRGRNNDLQMR